MSDKTELTPMQNFEEKVKGRLINDIGTLIPDEALSVLVNKAMEQAFFEPQKVVTGTGYHQKTELKPSIFEEQVKSLIQPLFEEQIKAWVSSNSERVEKQIESFLKSNAEKVFLSAIGSLFSSHFESMKWNIMSDIQNNFNGASQ